MAFLDILHSYFRGEKLEAFFFILPAGLALMVFSGVALRAERGGFAWGVAVPCLIFGLVAVGTGLGVGLRTAGQVAELEKSYQESPARMVETELPRMRTVHLNFSRHIYGYAILAVVGLILRFALKGDWAHGLGPALILIAGLGFLIDGFADRRAKPYTAALVKLAAEHEVESGKR